MNAGFWFAPFLLLTPCAVSTQIRVFNLFVVPLVTAPATPEARDGVERKADNFHRWRCTREHWVRWRALPPDTRETADRGQSLHTNKVHR